MLKQQQRLLVAVLDREVAHLGVPRFHVGLPQRDRVLVLLVLDLLPLKCQLRVLLVGVVSASVRRLVAGLDRVDRAGHAVDRVLHRRLGERRRDHREDAADGAQSLDRIVLELLVLLVGVPRLRHVIRTDAFLSEKILGIMQHPIRLDVGLAHRVSFFLDLLPLQVSQVGDRLLVIEPVERRARPACERGDVGRGVRSLRLGIRHLLTRADREPAYRSAR